MSLFKEEDIVSRYTERQAYDDGYLFPIQNHPVIRYVTTTVMSWGYMTEDDGGIHVNKPNLMDLLLQASLIVKRCIARGEEQPFIGRIELPSGSKQMIRLGATDDQRQYVITTLSDD